MLKRIEKKLTNYQQVAAILVTKLALVTLLFSAPANALTGKEVLTVLDEKKRYGYVSGIIEALAYADFLKNKPDETGMICRMDYFYKGGVESWKVIKKWFENNPDQQAYVLIFGLLNRECGK